MILIHMHPSPHGFFEYFMECTWDNKRAINGESPDVRSLDMPIDFKAFANPLMPRAAKNNLTILVKPSR